MKYSDAEKRLRIARWEKEDRNQLAVEFGLTYKSMKNQIYRWRRTLKTKAKVDAKAEVEAKTPPFRGRTMKEMQREQLIREYREIQGPDQEQLRLNLAKRHNLKLGSLVSKVNRWEADRRRLEQERLADRTRLELERRAERAKSLEAEWLLSMFKDLQVPPKQRKEILTHKMKWFRAKNQPLVS